MAKEFDDYTEDDLDGEAAPGDYLCYFTGRTWRTTPLVNAYALDDALIWLMMHYGHSWVAPGEGTDLWRAWLGVGTVFRRHVPANGLIEKPETLRNVRLIEARVLNDDADAESGWMVDHVVSVEDTTVGEIESAFAQTMSRAGAR